MQASRTNRASCATVFRAVSVAAVLLLSMTSLQAQPRHCIISYNDDFSFADRQYSEDTPSGWSINVSWGPHGYVGSILLPRQGDRDRVPLLRFDTIYLWLNCSLMTIDEIWQYFIQDLAERRDCSALYIEHAKAEFVCNGRSQVLTQGEDSLGPFLRHTYTGSGPSYRAMEYQDALETMESFVTSMVLEASEELVRAIELEPCDSNIAPTKQIRIESQEHADPSLSDAQLLATVNFTVNRDGSVSQIVLGETGDQYLEYLLSHAVRDTPFKQPSRACRHQWAHRFDTADFHREDYQ